uniref:ATP-binding protein n=1 Tax=uncultured Ruminococcus sp. TaxID=165186 RepID=UPI0025F7BA63
FYRADHSREDRSHFGLGLAIAKEIVELHNGTISIMNGQKQGTIFTVNLPIEHK